MALTKGYKAGATVEEIAQAKQRNPRNAGRKKLPENIKKQKVNIAMTQAEHERAIELKNRTGATSLSSLIVELIDKEYYNG